MTWDRTTILKKIARYCAYQERAHSEVRQKLIDIGCPWDEVDEFLVDLIQGNYVNEERFARSYARGKFRMKAWGRNKIRQGLYQKKVGENLIQYSLDEEIDEEEYRAKMRELIQKKQQQWAGLEPYILEGKIRQWLIGRGFETNLAWEMMKGD